MMNRNIVDFKQRIRDYVADEVILPASFAEAQTLEEVVTLLGMARGSNDNSRLNENEVLCIIQGALKKWTIPNTVMVPAQ
jgi:hypothetical protein